MTLDERIEKDLKPIAETIEAAYRMSYAASELPPEEFAEAIRTLPVADRMADVYAAIKELQRAMDKVRRGRKQIDG